MEAVRKIIDRVEKETKDLSKKYQVTIMSNSRSKTKKINGQYIEYSDENEFFSDQEFEEIHQGIQDAGFHVNASFNELSLIKKTLEHSYLENDQIIYNLSRNGRHVGKKSLMPSFFDLLNIPYTGSNAFVISLCREKYTYTKYLEAHGIRVPKTYIYLGEGKWLNHEKPIEGQALIIKPMQESASIGLSQKSIFSMPKNESDMLESLFPEASLPAIVQQFIKGYECEVPFFVSEAGEITSFNPIGLSISDDENLQSKILTYERSFTDDYGFYEFHNKVGKDKSLIIQKEAEKIAKLLNISQYGRIDFRVDATGRAFLIDVAATPYTTKHSSFAYIFEQMNIPYNKIYATIVGLAYLNFFIKSK